MKERCKERIQLGDEWKVLKLGGHAKNSKLSGQRKV